MLDTLSGSDALRSLNIPFQKSRIVRDGDVLKIFDPLRKNFYVLTPEEYVRQQFTSWLRSSLNYPESLMANEIGIRLNGNQRRCDTVIFNTDASPLMIIEYKSPDILITQDVFDQILRYNIVLCAPFLTVSNGLFHYCCKIDCVTGRYRFLKSIPDYFDIRNSERL